MDARKRAKQLMEFSDDLIRLFEADDEGLFTPPQKAITVTPDDRLTTSFRQISEFVEENDRLPDINASDINEASLAARLDAIKVNRSKVDLLKPVDSLGLLDGLDAPESLEALFSDENNGLFNEAGDEILKVKKVLSKPRPVKERAKRTRVKDFEKFEPGFVEQQKLLAEGVAVLRPFVSVNQLRIGTYYVQDGQMLYLVDARGKKRVYDRNQERLRIIYENGTESDMYRRSLAQRLYEGGYEVGTVGEETIYEPLSESDKISGYVYVLKSLSSDPHIQNIKNLYKIGFSTATIAERIKDAENDPTYLMAGVELVDNYILTSDYNPQKVEHFIHRIFADAKVEIEIIDKAGREYSPSEWYSVPRIAIEQAVNMLHNRDIVDYHYDNEKEQIVPNKFE